MFEARKSTDGTTNAPITHFFILSADPCISICKICDLLKALSFKKDWWCFESNTVVVDCISRQHVPARGFEFPIVANEIFFFVATKSIFPEAFEILQHISEWSVINAA